jgi:hypothetical protein
MKEKVRAKPAWDSTLASGFGWLSWGLGLAELFAPKTLARWLGLSGGAAPVIRGYGLREIGAGVGILQNPVGPQFMWARVAGDLLDLASLGAALKGKTTRPQRVGIALGVVGAITVLDVIMSARLTQLQSGKHLARAAT